MYLLEKKDVSNRQYRENKNISLLIIFFFVSLAVFEMLKHYNFYAAFYPNSTTVGEFWSHFVCTIDLYCTILPVSRSSEGSINLTFIGPCIVTYSYSKNNRMHLFLELFTLQNTLRVSDGLSVHHQEFKTVHTATGICQTDTATCLLAGTRWNISIPKS
jgi:hypothetical protein